MSKQKRPGEVVTTVEINGRKATSTSGAITILEKLTKHKYSRDAIYRMYVDGKIEGERTDVANFYYIDSLERVGTMLIPPEGQKRKGRHKKGEQVVYSDEIKEQARQMRSGGMTYREIAARLGVSNQIVQYWLKQVS